LSGGRLVRAPDWQITFGFDYEMPVDDDVKLKIGSDIAIRRNI